VMTLRITGGSRKGLSKLDTLPRRDLVSLSLLRGRGGEEGYRISGIFRGGAEIC